MKCAQVFVGWFFIFVTFANGFPSQPKCKDDNYFDHLKQTYLPCSECEDKQIECQICCSVSKPELVHASESSKTSSVSSLKENSLKANYQILNLFLQFFIVTMVICTLLVLVFVAYKVTRERQAAECSHQGNHFQNADANIVQEVYVDSSPMQGGTYEGTSRKESSLVGAKNFSLNERV